MDMNELVLFGDVGNVPMPWLPDLQREMELCERSGLKGKVKQIKNEIRLRSIAAKAEAKDMVLLLSRYIGGESWCLESVGSNGKVTRLHKGYEWFGRTKLSKYKGNIPTEILERLPSDAGKRGWIFELKDNDPIIAVKIGWGEYIGVFQWD
jgi:hypothetical protein